MTAVADLRGSADASVCPRCGEQLVAPEWSEYFSEEEAIINLWTCTRCSHRFETEAFQPIDPRPKFDERLVDEFLPALLIA